MKSLPINFRPVGALHDCSIFDMKNDLMLYRSATLDKTPLLLPRIKEDLAIESHIELRNSNEFDGLSISETFFVKKTFSLRDPEQLIRSGLEANYQLYGRSYLNIIQSSIGNIVDLLKFLTYSDLQRFVISCYAGKDRTGIISTLILLLFEMPSWLIYVDYVMSSSYLLQNLEAFEQNWLKRNMTSETYSTRFKMDPRALGYMLHHFDATHGGVVNYLKMHHFDNNDILNFNKKFYNHKKVLLSHYKQIT
jgi:hypothetical protein